MQAIETGVPTMITTRTRENANQEPVSNCTPKTAGASHMEELWNEIWFTKLKDKKIYQAIVNFDPNSMTDNPLEKVMIYV